MTKKDLIQQIEAIRGSRVITYLTSDRSAPVNARIAMDIIPVVSQQLRQIGKTEKIEKQIIKMLKEKNHNFITKPELVK